MEDIICFDIETTGLSMLDDYRIGAIHRDGIMETMRNPEELITTLVEACTRDKYLSGHNIVSFDLPFLISLEYRKYKTFTLAHTLRGRGNQILDTLIASRIEIPDVTGHSMTAWVERLRKAGDTNIPNKTEIEDWDTASELEILERVANDVKIQTKLTKYFCGEYGSKWEGLPCYQHISRIFPFMSEAVGRGIPLFKDKSDAIKARLIRDRATAALAVYREFGTMNPNSTKQINQAVLARYGKELPYTTKINKKGEEISNPSYSTKNRAECHRMFPDLNVVSEYRDEDKQLAFLKDTGKKSLVRTENNPNGTVVYPGFSFMAQEGLRSSYSDPPINQVDRRIRAMIGLGGWVCVGCDIESLEYTELAHTLDFMFSSPELKSELEAGVNPKDKTVQVFGDLFENIEEDKRRDVAKTLNYAVLYGQKVTGTLNLFKLPRDRYEEVEAAREERFPGLSELMEYIEGAKDNDGCIMNKYGVGVKVYGHEGLNKFVQSSGALASYTALGLFYHNLFTRLSLIHI